MEEGLQSEDNIDVLYNEWCKHNVYREVLYTTFSGVMANKRYKSSKS